MAGTGQDDADGILGQAAGHGVKERIDRRDTDAAHPRTSATQDHVAVPQFGDRAPAGMTSTCSARPRAVRRLRHRHRCPTRQDLRQHALAASRQMQDDNERQAAVGRHPFKELVKCLDAAGRRTDGHQAECGLSTHGPAQPRVAAGLAAAGHAPKVVQGTPAGILSSSRSIVEILAFARQSTVMPPHTFELAVQRGTTSILQIVSKLLRRISDCRP